MITTKYGKVVKGLGGLFETRIYEDGEVSRLASRAKGILKRDRRQRQNNGGRLYPRRHCYLGDP